MLEANARLIASGTAPSVPPPHPDPFDFFLPGSAFPFVWGVWVGGDTILASDINFGLYVLKHLP
ncbi:hypothetical protein [Thermoflexus hugenholtzii]